MFFTHQISKTGTHSLYGILVFEIRDSKERFAQSLQGALTYCLIRESLEQTLLDGHHFFRMLNKINEARFDEI